MIRSASAQQMVGSRRSCEQLRVLPDWGRETGTQLRPGFAPQ